MGSETLDPTIGSTVIGAINNLGQSGSGEIETLLWTNTSTSSFAQGTVISVPNLDNYKFITVESDYRWNANWPRRFKELRGHTLNIVYEYSGVNPYNYPGYKIRSVMKGDTANSVKLTDEQGSYNWQAVSLENTDLIPLRIYGSNTWNALPGQNSAFA